MADRMPSLVMIDLHGPWKFRVDGIHARKDEFFDLLRTDLTGHVLRKLEYVCFPYDRFLKVKPSGLFDMQNVLGLR